MIRAELLRVFESSYITNIERKEISMKAGYGGADSGVQGLKKYMSAATVQLDDKNVKKIMYNYLGHGRFRWICEELNIKLEYGDILEDTEIMAYKLKDNIKKMNYEDAKRILDLLNS